MHKVNAGITIKELAYIIMSCNYTAAVLTLVCTSNAECEQSAGTHTFLLAAGFSSSLRGSNVRAH